jgi:hypothetical protein
VVNNMGRALLATSPAGGRLWKSVSGQAIFSGLSGASLGVSWPVVLLLLLALVPFICGVASAAKHGSALSMRCAAL